MYDSGLNGPAGLEQGLESQGYGVWPQALDASTLAALSEELQHLEATGSPRDPRTALVDASRFMQHQLQFEACPAVHRLIVCGPGARAVGHITGDTLVCTGATYAHCRPGHRGIALHTDYDPYAGNVYRPSNPIALRVLYYLDALTHERAPLRVLPESHLRLHQSWRYDRSFHELQPGEISVSCEAGDAVIINTKLFHGVGPNLSQSGRRVVAITYRPRWAAPLQAVPEHAAQRLAQLPPQLRALFEDLNAGTASP